jgi:ABC-2 type transport system permease protein
MSVRSTVPLLGAALLLPLALPGDPAGWAALALSMVVAAVVAFELRFLLSAAVFWTPDYRFVFNLLFSVVWLLTGFVVPTDYFPGWLRVLADAGPLHAVVMAPFAVAIGRSVPAELAGQAAWAVALGGAGLAVMGLARRRLVVHGG